MSLRKFLTCGSVSTENFKYFIFLTLEWSPRTAKSSSFNDMFADSSGAVQVNVRINL